MIEPLKGQRILITREIQQAKPLAKLVEFYGGTACIAPLLRFEPIITNDTNDKLNQLQDNSKWLFFTSSNTVRLFENYREKLEITINLKIASVGEKTSLALRNYGYSVDFEPTVYSGTAMAKEFIAEYGKDQQVTIVCGESAREEIPQILSENSVSFDKLVIYRTIENGKSKDILHNHLVKGVDACLFTSPSTVKAFVHFSGMDLLRKVKAGTVCVAIGKTTADALKKEQFAHVIYPEKYTTEAMVAALIDYKKDGEEDDRV
ncbi:uroporphyrinogen-III synthase [Gracilibacillus oryzae]|uniref:Uroporphyrinogen-III synthase n=1 Tax=Gracilibacillus oryzae TaxID=1672701 RepID=A0A7C8KTN9_9BACI|nr:uroporphyrinogen-III synthase [Gracilibacillus oryzae]KAB8134715.1 uroporphyrinogen-III synthase [Gracilibacillus oryzae]